MDPRSPARLHRYTWLLAAGWTLAVGASFVWNRDNARDGLLFAAKVKARALFDKDVVYRSWNAMHGGVYVPVSDRARPNPYLAGRVAERDVLTTTGRRLTLVNPAYMTRQALEIQNRRHDILGHITSLRPIRPGNAPDPWERSALRRFAQRKVGELTAIEAINNERHLRLMRPLITERSCLQCHANQGYRVGDVRGGISVSVPLAPYEAMIASRVATTGLAHLGLWLVGLAGLYLGHRRIRRAQARADEAGRAKATFLANMSHEIRTPMNGVIGMTSLLLDTDLEPRQRGYAETIRGSADALLTVINDILDFSKVEAGKLDLEEIDFDLRTTLESTNDLLALRAQEKGLEYTCLIGPDVPPLLRGDPARLKQILTNLIGNAVKFTPEGDVGITVTLEQQDEARVTPRFTVWDSGIGIPADKQAGLFEAFTQADLSTTRRYGGTGLGLSICKRLVELLGGEIGVESEPGRGATFWFTADFARQPPGASPPRPRVRSLSGMRVLVVDDNRTNRHVCSEMLRRWDCEPEAAADGPSALACLRDAAERGRPFDMAIVDMNMPGMDGAELGEQVKGDPLVRRTPLVMMTSIGQRGDAARMERIGFAAYLTKPVKQTELYGALTLTGAPGDPAQRRPIITRHTIDEARRRPLRVLLAEDNRTNQLVAVKMLEGLGAVVEVVDSGKRALEALQAQAFDLVLMDIQMPEMDGLTATRAIRDPASGVRDTSVPIIAMTAHAMAGDRERCLAAGMDDYVSKPIQPSELAAAVGRQVAARRDASDAPPGADAPPVFDRDALLERLGGDEDTVRMLVEIFFEETPDLLRALGQAVERGERDQVRSRAHRLKGAAANINAEGLRAPLARLESAGADGDLSDAARLHAAACSALDDLREELRSRGLLG